MKGVNVGSPEYNLSQCHEKAAKPALQFATVDQELYNWAVTSSFNKNLNHGVNHFIQDFIIFVK